MFWSEKIPRRVDFDADGKATEICCIAGLLGCRRLLERAEPMPAEDDYLVYTFNRFQACRFGLDGTMVNPRTSESRTIREDILATLRHVEPHFAALQSLPALAEVERCAARDGNHATHLRAVFAETRNVQSLVQEGVRALRAGHRG